ncbi:MAG: hypothetical protein ACLP50_29605 [Solirubrobacteraceae bacterium]
MSAAPNHRAWLRNLVVLRSRTSAPPIAATTIGRSLHAGVAGLQWARTGYLLTVAALLLLSGGAGRPVRSASAGWCTR